MYDISQAGFLPPLDKEAAGIITGSEAIVKEFASKHSLTASAINDLIKDGLTLFCFSHRIVCVWSHHTHTGLSR